MPNESFLRRLLKENVVLLLAVMIILIPLLAPFTASPSGRALRNGLFQSVGILLLVVLLARFEFRGGIPRLLYLARTAVNLPVLAFLLWATLSALRVSAPADRAFAVGELLRLGIGALVYFAVVLHIEARPQLSLLIDCLIGLVIAVTGYGLMAQGLDATNGNRIWTIFPSRHHLSAILAVLFPLLAWLALEVENLPRRLAATVAVIGCGFGLLISLERSAWIAVTVGLVTGFALATRTSDWGWTRQSWRPSLAVVATCLLVGAGFFFISDVDVVVARRSQQLSAAVHGQDQSFAWRVQKWRGAAAMVAARPGWGWGPGRFVLFQEPYTHLGLTQADVRSFGAGFDEMAYNDYLQTAAELGLPGLALYLLILVSFFSKAGHAFYQLQKGLRRTVLLGCIAGIAAQMVDAMANGSWRYAECSFYFWLILGLGMAVTRMANQTGKEVVNPVQATGLPWKPP